MVSLDSIRRRSGLLLVVIGVAMFAFIMMDLMSSQRSGGSSDISIGEIYGESVDIRSFEFRVQEQVDSERRTNPNVDVTQVRNSVWNQMVRELVMKKEYESLGLEVSSDELFDMIQGNNPNSSVKEAFTNPETGAFDRARLLQYLKEDIDNDITGETRARWVKFEKALQQNRTNQKYNTLVSKGLNLSEFEAQLNYNFQNEVRNVSYIQVPFKTIVDSLIDVSDSELIDFMNDNSDRFQQEESRSIEYVVFTVNPSEADDKAALDWSSDIKEDFSLAEDDEKFLKRYSDGPSTQLTYVNKDVLSNNVISLFSADEGTVIGPYKEGNKNYRLAKLVSSESRPDSVKARHILLTGNNSAILADSLKNLIDNGVSFSSLAEQNSQDPGSASKGGDLGWFVEGVMVSEFNEACFTAKTGNIELVNSQFGTHIVEVVNKSSFSKKVKIAYLDRKVEPSNETYSGMFTKAGKFAAENNTYAEFNETVSNENLSKRIAENLNKETNTVTGLENPRELIRWAYNAKINEVSDVFTFANKFVIATLTDINNEGMQDLEDVRAEITTDIRNQKRSVMLQEQLQGMNSLEELADDYGVSVKNVEGVTFNNNQVTGLGNEPSFVGAAFSLNEGETSPPFAGSSAVFVMRIDNVISAPEGDVSKLKKQLSTALQSRAGYQVYQSLQKLAEVQDNRSDLY